MYFLRPVAVYQWVHSFPLIMRTFSSSAALLLVGIGLSTTAVAQTTPARTAPPARDTSAHRGLSEKPPLLDTQGQYVAPGMTGAPKQKVLTDYDNNVIQPRVEEKAPTSLSAQPVDPKDAKRIKMKRPPKRD